MSATTNPVQIYLCYADADRSGANALVRHLTPMKRSGKIEIELRTPPEGGIATAESQAEEAKGLQSADVILLLVSSQLEIDRIDEVTAALKERERRRARVIPVLYSSVSVDELLYKDLRMLPDGAPIVLRRDKDEAWVEVVMGIRRVVETLAKEKAVSSPEQAPAAPHSPAAPRAAAKEPIASPPSTQFPQGTTAQSGVSRSAVKVLFLGANPADTTRLHLGSEIREIDQRIQFGQHRERFILEQDWAVRAADLSQILLRRHPTIVHFSGHGTKSGQIVLENDSGNAMPVSTGALSGLFRIFAPKGIRLVVLNACYSTAQAQAIAQHVECVVGISETLPDRGAQSFSAGFYSALVAGENAQDAFELGCVQIELMGLTGAERPMLLCRDPQAFRLVTTE